MKAGRHRGLTILILCLLHRSVAQEAVFRTESRLVEVYATVLDRKGRYVDTLTQSDFQITDNGQRQPIVSFENSATGLSCALLIDTTGSMTRALPAVRSGVSKLIDQFRDGDSVAVYGFSTGLQLLEDFTSDKARARRAVFRIRAGGATALYDSLSRMAAAIAGHKGKKSIVVLTDGDDNASVLNAQRASDPAKRAGIPIYTVAEGEALQSHGLMQNLETLARLTGGRAYIGRKPQDLLAIFDNISGELQHTYLITYRPPAASDEDWRQIGVTVEGEREYKIRAKEGYFPAL